MTASLTRRQLVGAGAAGAAFLATGARPTRAAGRRTRRADVCVIGAGLSGLTAARALVAADRTVVVLEPGDRVGGRTLNAALPGGHVTEIGGEFAGPTQTHIFELARAVGIKTFATYTGGSSVHIAGGARSLYPAVPGIPTDPEIVDGLAKALELDVMAKQVGVAAPWKAKKAREWDRMTLGDFVESRVASTRARASFTAAAEAIGVNVLGDRLSVHARYAIVAVPPPLAARMAFAPRLPARKAALLKGFEGGQMAKVEAVYSRPFWRDAGLSGQGVADVGPASTTFDNSPPDGSLGVLLGFVGGSSYRRWAGLPADQRRAQALASFAAFVGDQANAPREYLERNWVKEQWSRGCPVSHLPVGVLTKHGRCRPAGRVHFAGSETSDYWIGYMDSAVRAGQRAAREVIAADKR